MGSNKRAARASYQAEYLRLIIPFYELPYAAVVKFPRTTWPRTFNYQKLLWTGRCLRGIVESGDGVDARKQLQR